MGAVANAITSPGVFETTDLLSTNGFLYELLETDIGSEQTGVSCEMFYGEVEYWEIMEIASSRIPPSASIYFGASPINVCARKLSQKDNTEKGVVAQGC